MEDKDIVNLLKTNPNKGFHLFMKKYKEPIYWHIRRLVISYDDSKDVAQETFVRIFRNINQYSPDKSFVAWIYRIATNESLRFMSKQTNEKASLVQAFSVKSDPYIDYSDLESIKLQKAIHTLPPKQLAAFCMRYFDDMSFEDIALATDSTPSSVKMNYKLAKDKIIKYIKNYE